MKNLFRGKPQEIPPAKPLRQPVILSVEQLDAVLKLHSYQGSSWVKGLTTTHCGCGANIAGGFDQLRHHQAVEIAELQK